MSHKVTGNERINIAFFGESVANGFLFSPYFTPSQYLEKILLKVTKKSIRVIDKTKVSIRIKEMESLFDDPDVDTIECAIVFAGNNFRKDFWNEKEGDWERILEEISNGESWHKVIHKEFQQFSDEMVQELFDRMKQRFCDRDIPVIFVIPEFNLRDWDYNYYEIAQNWPEEGVPQIEQLKDKLKAALGEEITKTAQEFICADPSNPYGYIKLARYYDELGETKAAFTYYKEALNTNIYRLGPPPGINDYIRKSILHVNREDRIHLLDLRDQLNSLEDGRIAGNDYFIDYCHLNVNGIVTVCESIAPFILKELGLRSFDTMKDSRYLPSDEVTSNAYFYAALHSAHSGNLNQEYLSYQLRMAMKHDQNIADKMVNFARMASEKIPWRLNKNYLKINSNQYPTIRQPKDCMVLDVELVEAMVNVLEEFHVMIRDEIEQIRCKEHMPLINRKIDLLETYYRESSYFNTFIDSKSIDYENNHLSYCAFRNQETRFHLIATSNKELKCNIRMRAPYMSQKREVKIYCNQKLVFAGMISEHWKKYTFTIQRQNLTSHGNNEIIILWPSLNDDLAMMEKKIKRDYFSGYEKFINRIRPRYGDIYEFSISTEG